MAASTPGMTRTRHGLPMTRGHDALEPVDVVEVVHHDQADAVLDRQLEFLVALGVAVQDEPARIGARLERGQDLAAARDVEVQTLLDHDPLNGRARERLRRERHVAARPSAAERGEVVAGALPQSVLGRRRWPGCRTARPLRRGGTPRRSRCRRCRGTFLAGRGRAAHRWSPRYEPSSAQRATASSSVNSLRKSPRNPHWSLSDLLICL